MKILFLSTRAAKPSFRFRVLQMLRFFEEQGHEVETALLSKNAWKRFAQFQQLPKYDVVFLQKRLLSWAELKFARMRSRRLIYDLDDAVMYDSAGTDDGRRRARFRAMCRAADLVICGNSYLAEEATNSGGSAKIIPTAIDTERFHPSAKTNSTSSDGETITIGWTGSRSTNSYLNAVLPVLAQFAGRIDVRIISDTPDGIELSLLKDVPRRFIPWSAETEVSEAATFDIGLMPLPDDPWTRGKCGFKALQYMALGIPAVCSPVGVNREIIHDAHDGFLATTRDDWHRAIARLIREPHLRRQIGVAGRRRVETAYALNVVGPQLVQAVASVHSARKSA
ncbi:MAG: glycosyltransferase family 4 protein [Planctomycetaceae bacterium]